MKRTDLRSRAELGRLWYDQLRRHYLDGEGRDKLRVEQIGNTDASHSLDRAVSRTMRDVLTDSSPAEAFVSDCRLIQAIIGAKRDDTYEMLDLWHVPFPRTWWEFSKPVEIGGVPIIAAMFYTDFSNGLAVAGLIERISARGFNLHGAFEYGIEDDNSMGGTHFEEDAEHKRAIARLWDYITSRNLSYEIVNRKRSRIKLLESKYTHKQGKKSVVRQVFDLSVNRTIPLPADPAERERFGGVDWSNRIYIPGAFHRWVYCEKCGRLHRHDLIGQPCRNCGEVVGSRKNIRVEKYWHAPHWKGREAAPAKEVIRHVTK